MSIAKLTLALVAFLFLIGVFNSSPRERHRIRRDLRAESSPGGYGKTPRSQTRLNRSSWAIDLQPGFSPDNDQYRIPYDFTVRDNDGRDIRFRGHLQLARADEDTYIATPDRDISFATGELLAHVVENLGQLAERTIHGLQNLKGGYEEGRRLYRTTSNLDEPDALQTGARPESGLESEIEAQVERKNINEESNPRRRMPYRGAR